MPKKEDITGKNNESHDLNVERIATNDLIKNLETDEQVEASEFLGNQR
jgi:hypothetical protein